MRTRHQGQHDGFGPEYGRKLCILSCRLFLTPVWFSFIKSLLCGTLTNASLKSSKKESIRIPSEVVEWPGSTMLLLHRCGASDSKPWLSRWLMTLLCTKYYSTLLQMDVKVCNSSPLSSCCWLPVTRHLPLIKWCLFYEARRNFFRTWCGLSCCRNFITPCRRVCIVQVVNSTLSWALVFDQNTAVSENCIMVTDSWKRINCLFVKNRSSVASFLVAKSTACWRPQ